MLTLGGPLAFAAPGDIVSGGGRGGNGSNSIFMDPGGAGGMGGIGGGGGGAGGEAGSPGATTPGGNGGNGAFPGVDAQRGSNSGTLPGLPGLAPVGDLSGGGGGGSGSGDISGLGGQGGDGQAGTVDGSAIINLTGAIMGGSGSGGPGDGQLGGVSAGGGGGGGGGAALIVTSPNASVAGDGNFVQGGGGGDAVPIFRSGGGGGGGAGIVLLSGGLITLSNAQVLGGDGGGAGAGSGTSGGQGGAGIFLVDGGTLHTVRATQVFGGTGGGTLATGAAGGAGVLANRGSIVNEGTIQGGFGGEGVRGGIGGPGIVANGTSITNAAGATINGGTGGTVDNLASTVPGNGGVAIQFINTGGTLANAGTINGGAGGDQFNGGSARGDGSIAITTEGGTSVTNVGTIAGGTGASGRANAIEFNGGANRLTITAGSSILGNVLSRSGTTNGGDTLALGGDTTDGTTTFDVSRIGVLGGSAQYQGFGNFQKTGASTWTLTGTTSNATPWTIQGGVLSISNDQALGDVAVPVTLDGGALRNTVSLSTSRPIAVAAGGGALDVQQNLALFGALSGNGALSKTGSGTLALNGVSTYTGTLTVQSGELVVGDLGHGGAVLPGAVTVNGGATLSGAGTVGNTVVAAGGIIAPGLSIGTLHVAGNLTMAAGSIYQVQVAPGGSASDLIQVTGTATLGGSVVHVGPDGNFDPSRDYTIVTAGQGVSGSFNSVSSNLAFLTPTLAYGAHDVTLRLRLKDVPDDGGGNGGNSGTGGNGGSGGDGGSGTGSGGAPDGGNAGGGGTRPIRFADAAVTRNQRAVANAVQSLPSGNPVYLSVLNLAEGAPPAAFDSLSGEVHPSTTSVLQSIGDTVASVPLDHLRANLGAGLAPGAPTAQLGPSDAAALPRSAARPVWAQLVGNWRSFGGGGDAAKVKESDGGLFVGGDGAIGGGWRLGGALGYTGSHLRQGGGATANIDSYSALVQGGKSLRAGPGDVQLMAGAAYTWHDIGTRRNAQAGSLSQSLDADYHASTAQVFGEVGYRVPVGDKVALQPFVGVNYSDLRTRGFSESGGTAALDGDSQRNKVTTTTLGLRAEAKVESAGKPGRVYAMAGWRHGFGDLDPETTLAFADSTPFTVAGAPIARDSAVTSVGIDMQVSRSATFGVAYNGQFGGGNRQNAGTVNVRWQF
ncbi:autotransporter outer membrane beta-barrel domain-containing protein [Bordetella sp. H567]|uniref:autotransporter outer membrane beta-barrel domain-containing protein n=1 Tax=Bordetella sp. H567 TaxID=1697043 RepID=UPI0011AB5F6C|nr:autotransporter domain-containing protein [Bordetella sp. H567]